MRRAALFILAAALCLAGCSGGPALTSTVPAASTTTARQMTVPNVVGMSGDNVRRQLLIAGAQWVVYSPGDMAPAANTYATGQDPPAGRQISSDHMVVVMLSKTPPVVATTVAVPATPPPPASLTTFSDGTYEAGTGTGQVAPGKYKSTGPDDGGPVCYYARLKSGDGAAGDIITNDLSSGPSIMIVKASDGMVQVTGCTFVKS